MKKRALSGSLFVLALMVSAPAGAGWQWMNPFPLGNSIESVWISETDSVYIAASDGMVWQLKNSDWNPMELPSDIDVHAIWGFSDTSVWVAGSSSIYNGVILQYDGVRWRMIHKNLPFTLLDLWGSSPQDLYAAGSLANQDTGVLVHFSDASWARVDEDFGSGLNAVWGFNSSNVYVCGSKGFIAHFDGNRWEEDSISTQADFSDIGGFDADNIYVVGSLGTTYKWNGALWQIQPTGITSRLNSIHANPNGVVFACGDGGTILQIQNNTWINVSPGTISAHLNAIFCSGHLAIAAGDSGIVLTYTLPAGSFSCGADDFTLVSGGSIEDMKAVWSFDPESVFSAGMNGTVLRWDGAVWTDISSGDAPQLRTLWGNSENDVWVAGVEGYIAHYDGIEWTRFPISQTNTINSLWGFSSTHIFAAGTDGLILQWNGHEWLQMNSGTTLDLFSLHGVAENDVYAAGGRIDAPGTALSILLHFNGTTWQTLHGDPAVLTGVYSTESSGLFFTGYTVEGASNPEFTGYLFKVDGQGWHEIISVKGVKLNGITRCNNWILACGDDGLVLQWDGIHLVQLLSRTSSNLISIAADQTAHITVCGSEAGCVLQWEGSFPDPDMLDGTGVDLKFNRSHFSPGDRFDLTALVWNQDVIHHSGDLYLALDIGSGDFWFWPSWTHFPGGIDFSTVSVDPGNCYFNEVLLFQWPDTGSAAAGGLRFWAFWIDQSSMVGSYDLEEFSFGP